MTKIKQERVKMKILMLFLIGVIFSTNIGYALDCQYTEIQKYSQDDIVYYHNNQKIGTNLDMNALVTVTIEGFNIRITNNLSVPVSLNVNYHRDSKWFGIYEDRAVAITVKPKDFEYIRDEMNNILGCGSWPCAISLNKYSFVDPNIIRSETVSVIKEKEVCKFCSGKTCLNDGANCTSSTECGGNYCVNGYCSNSELCFNNDCKCPSDEIQCSDNKRCVKKSVVPIDLKPECNKPQECVTGYINLETGLCAKSPTQLQDEENQRLKEDLLRKEKEMKFGVYAIIGIIILVLIGLNFSNKHEKEKQKTIEKETEKEAEKQKTLRQEIDRVNAEITYLKNSRLNIRDDIESGKKEANRLKEQIREAKNSAKIEHEKRLNELEKIQDERKERLRLNEEELSQKEKQQKLRENELDENDKKIKQRSYESYITEQLNKYKKAYETPFFQIDFDEDQQYFVVKERKSGKLRDSLHRWIYKKEIDKNIENKEVHHIDYDVLNNELWNLIALPKENHNKEYGRLGRLIHSKIRKRDWNSGIQQLQEQLGMKKEDFPEHVQNHMQELDNETSH